MTGSAPFSFNGAHFLAVPFYTNASSAFERHGEKEPQRGDGGVDRPGADLLLRHMQLKATLKVTSTDKSLPSIIKRRAEPRTIINAKPRRHLKEPFSP
jgi:hypothetical protein